MKKKQIIFLLIILSNLLFIIIYVQTRTFNNQKLLEYNFITNLSINFDLLSNSNQNNKISNVNMADDSYCEKKSEWEEIDRWFYIKKSGGYFFLDKKEINILFLCEDKRKFEIGVYLIFYQRGRRINKYLTNSFLRVLRYDKSPYKSGVIIVSFDLRQFAFENDFRIDNDLKVFAYLSYLNSQIVSNNPIKIKVKYLHKNSKSKKDIMICSKIYSLKKEDSLLIENWISYHTTTGISKIVIYNNSIENSQNFENLFEKYSNLIEIRQSQCFPTFSYMNTENKYFRTFNDLLTLDEESFPHRWTIEVVTITDCYLDHVDKYKMISVVDQDEVIFPRKLKQFYPMTNDFSYLKFSEHYLSDSFDNECNSKNPSLLLPYTIKLIFDLKLNYYSNVHFRNGFYITHTFAEEIFQKINQQITSNTKLPFRLFVKDEEQSLYKSRDIIYKFKIDNFEDLNYSLTLNRFYLNHLKPFIVKHRNKSLERLHPTYFRFFYFSGSPLEWRPSKTVHNTLNSKYIQHHWPIQPNEYQMIPYQYGHLSHFRKRNDIISKGVYFSITDLKFDLNYFACYLKPIIISKQF